MGSKMYYTRAQTFRQITFVVGTLFLTDVLQKVSIITTRTIVCWACKRSRVRAYVGFFR